MSKNFIRDGIELPAYFAATRLTDEFVFRYRPMGPKAAEVELDQLENGGLSADKVYDLLVARFLSNVTSWDCNYPQLNSESVRSLNRLILWRAVRLILGNDAVDKDPNTDRSKTADESGSSIVGKSEGLTS